MTIGQILQSARIRKKLTLRGLEEKSGIKNPVISQIETGRVKEPGFRTICRLAKALRVPLGKLAKAGS